VIYKICQIRIVILFLSELQFLYMGLPYKVRYKLPLEYLTLQDWNNFVKDLLFINQYGSAKLLQYYKNGNLKNLNEVIAKYLYVSALKVAGYNVLHNLSQPLAYTFGEGNQQPFESMAKRQLINFEYLVSLLKEFKFLQFYPISKLPNYKLPIFPIQELEIMIPQIKKQLQLIIPKLISKITIPNQIAGTQFIFSGTTTVQQLIETYLNLSYLQNWSNIIIQNLGNSPVEINNSIYLMPKQCLEISTNPISGKCLKIVTTSPSNVQLIAQSPTLLSLGIEFIEVPSAKRITAYKIVITNTQPVPTQNQFQQFLQLDLSSILSSPSQLLNLQFCLDPQCQTPLYAWISQYNSNLSNVLIWILLPNSISANSSIPIYMFVKDSIQYPYTGINAYYDTEYDNGSYIFDAYINAMGTQYIPSNLGFFSIAYSTIQFVPKNGQNPGYIIMLDNQTNSSTQIFLQKPNGFNVNQIFEGIEYLNGNGGYQQMSFLGKLIPVTRYFKTIGDIYSTLFIPSSSESEITFTGILGTTIEATGSGSMFTTSGYNFYQAIVTSSGIEFYGSSVQTPIIDLSQLNLQLAVSWQSQIIAPGSFFEFTDGATNESHVGYFYWARVRKLPPNNVMPSNSQPQKITISV